jgi:hypothetical protein
MKPFKKIWQRDKTKTKNIATMELAFIYFFADPRSDYQYIVDEDDRIEEIKKGQGLSDDWKPDDVVKSAISFYESFMPTSAMLLEDTRVAVDKLRKKLKDIDLDEVDDKGRPIYTLNTITATIKQVPDLAKQLMEAEKAISEQIHDDGKSRGALEKTLLDDSLDF